MKYFYLIALALALLPGSPAAAHRLNVFAWLENDQILVDCNFGKDRPAANATVMVLDGATNKEILDGRTNPQGRFSFPVPNLVRQGHTLIIQVNAGEGHQGQWAMDASELYAAASLAAGFEDASLKEANRTSHTNIAFPSSAPSPEELRTLINSLLEAQLAPIRHQLAEQATGKISLVEILGGLGWIMGLVGIAMYFRAKGIREKSENAPRHEN